MFSDEPEKQTRPWSLKFSRGRLAVWLLLCGSLALGGCGQGVPGLVYVSGKLTYDGGKWPAQGEIIFSPVEKIGDRPLLPAMAHIEEDGSFVVLTSESKGLMPGKYRAAIRCRVEAPNPHEPIDSAREPRRAGRNAIPERYTQPTTSELEVVVPDGSKPITLNWDIRSK